jgi:hypothetical protein
MSDEQENDGTWSGLKKTIIGTLATVVTAGGAWVGTTIFSGGEEVAPVQQQAAQPIILNVDNSSQNNSSNSAGGSTTVIKETVREVQSSQPAPAQAAPVEEKVETSVERMKRLKAEKAKQDEDSK